MTKISRQAGATFTTVLNLALVLLVVGATAMAVIITRHVVQQARTITGVTVALDDNTASLAIDSLQQLIAHRPYTAQVTFISRDVALQQWNRETGEDLLATLGENPLSDVIEVQVKPEWTAVDSLRRVGNDLRALTGVADVATNEGDVARISHNGNRVTTVMSVVSLILMVMAVVLMWTTLRLRLAGEAERIGILSLVGATRGFIVKPYVFKGAAWGALAAVLSSVVLASVWAMSRSSHQFEGRWLASQLNGTDVLWVALLLLAMGTTIAAATAWMACHSHLESLKNN